MEISSFRERVCLRLEICTHFYSSINNKNAILRKHFHVKERVMRAAPQHLSLCRCRQLSLTHYCGVPRKYHVFQKKQERKSILLSQQVLCSNEMMRNYRAMASSDFDLLAIIIPNLLKAAYTMIL